MFKMFTKGNPAEVANRLGAVLFFPAVIYVLITSYSNSDYFTFSIAALMTIYFTLAMYNYLLLFLAFRANVNGNRKMCFRIISLIWLPVFLGDKHNRSWYAFLKGSKAYFYDDYMTASKFLTESLQSDNFNKNAIAYIFSIKAYLKLSDFETARVLFEKFQSFAYELEFAKEPQFIEQIESLKQELSVDGTA